MFFKKAHAIIRVVFNSLSECQYFKVQVHKQGLISLAKFRKGAYLFITKIKTTKETHSTSHTEEI